MNLHYGRGSEQQYRGEKVAASRSSVPSAQEELLGFADVVLNGKKQLSTHLAALEDQGGQGVTSGA